MSEIYRWSRVVRHARTVERAWARLDEAVHQRDLAVQRKTTESLAVDQLVELFEQAQDQAYFYVLSCWRMAANMMNATHHFANVITQGEIESMRVLRNFWEHEDDYPLLEPPDVQTPRRETLALLSQYGRSPALRSLVWRSNVNQSIIISNRFNASEWREKARILAKWPPPRDGNASIKQPAEGRDRL